MEHCMKVDKDYAAFVRDRENKEKELELRKQAEFMASAMKSAFTSQADDFLKKISRAQSQKAEGE